MTLKTPRQRRTMRKAIRMAKAGQREIAAARFDHIYAEIRSTERYSRAHSVALVRARRALELLLAIEDIRLVPCSMAAMRWLRRAGWRLNARHA
jgi:hypothetical protein